MGKKNDQFNPAFKGLAKKFKDLPEKQKPAPTLPPPPPKPEKTDLLFFQDAMNEVVPLADSKKRTTRMVPENRRPPHPAPDEDHEVMEHLADLVSGAIEMDITLGDEYMEGAVKGLGPKIMKRLKRGQIPVQDHIDLHGLTKQEAKEAVREFLLQSHRNGLRSLLIVHGRGLNSPDSFPVLKEGLPRWLSSGPVRKIVLAFATARPYDGGTGAVYVLLRNRKGSPHLTI